MTGVAGALLALVLHARPPTDTGVWLSAPAAGSVVPARLDVTGEAQAPEGVLRLDLYVVRGTSMTMVDSYVPVVPRAGTVPFTLHWSRGDAAPGRVTVRVVATTLLRGLSAESAGLVVPGRPAPPPARVAHPLPEPPSSAPPRHLYAARRAAVSKLVVDDSGRPFGAVAPVLPYAAPSVRVAPPRAAPLHSTAVRTPVPPDRQGAVSVAAGLLVLLACSHLHRVLRTRPDPRDPA
jgi:hypothetical protein